MTTTKQCAIKLIEEMSEDKVLAFIHLIADENTIARIETMLVENDPNAKTYSSFRELREELDAEDE